MNSEKAWFKKIFIGFIPVSWAGWIITLGFILFGMVAVSLAVALIPLFVPSQSAVDVLPIIVVPIVLIETIILNIIANNHSK